MLRLKLNSTASFYSTLYYFNTNFCLQCKIKDFYYGSFPGSCWIANANTIDFDTEYSIFIVFREDRLLITIKWNINFNLFKEIIEWLHGLTLQLYFENESKTINSINHNLNKCIKLIENNITFNLVMLTYYFDWEIEENIGYEYKQCFKEFFKQLIKIDWNIFIESLVCNNSEILMIIFEWMVI